MKNEQKKEYVKPEMIVVEYEHENDLLCASTDVECNDRTVNVIFQD